MPQNQQSDQYPTQEELINFTDHAAGVTYEGIPKGAKVGIEKAQLEVLAKHGKVVTPQLEKELKELRMLKDTYSSNVQELENRVKIEQGKELEVKQSELQKMQERLESIAKENEKFKAAVETMQREKESQKLQGELLQTAKALYPDLNDVAFSDTGNISYLTTQFFRHNGQIVVSDGNGDFLKDENGLTPISYEDHLKKYIDSRPWFRTASIQPGKQPSTSTHASAAAPQLEGALGRIAEQNKNRKSLIGEIQ